MTESDLIFDYIDRFFKVDADNVVIIVAKDNIGFEYKCTSIESFIRHLDDFLGYRLTPETVKLVREWFEDEEYVICKQLREFLSDYRVKLGMTDWKVIHKVTGDDINVDDIANHFVGLYSKSFVNHYYDTWYSGAIIVESSRQMNNWG
jgi:hypothetical protein